MANYWGSGQHGNYGSRFNPNNQYTLSSNIPGLRLRNYEGQFDREALGEASQEMRSYIERMQDTTVWNRIQRKTEVNIYGTIGSSDGFGEASNRFSHAGLPEFCDDQDVDEAEIVFNLQFQRGLQEYSKQRPKQTATATVTNENSRNDSARVIDNAQDDTTSSDCLIVDKTYSLESDGIELVQNEAEAEVVVIEDDPSDDSPDENLFNIYEFDSSNPREYFESNSEVKKTETKIMSTFKCDFCPFVSDVRPLAQQHLKNAVHFAASEYTLDNAGKMKLKIPRVLMNFTAKFKTVLVVCPNPSCRNVFQDIHACAEHYNARHLKTDHRRGRYSLIDVVKEEACVYAINPMLCYVCKEQFDCRAYLKNHFNNSGHYPVSDMKDCQKIFFCVYCNTSFDTFENIAPHQRQAHRKSANNGALNFTVFHYKRVEYHTLVDGQNSASSDGTSACVGTSKRMHDGTFMQMEPKKKIRMNNEYSSRTSDENCNNTTGSNTNYQGHVENIDNAWQYKSSLQGTSQQSVDYDSERKLTEIFKCDYCMKMARAKNVIYMHLVHDVHSSASTFLTDHQGNIVYLKETKTVSFQGANFKKIAAICSEGTCGLLFDSIFTCEDHNIRCHHSKGGYYHVADIVDRIPNKVSISENICSVCRQEFEKSSQLYAHYSESDHFPFKNRADCMVYVLCCYCHVTFSSYKVASEHVKRHQGMAQNGMVDTVILYVSKQLRQYSIPPYQPTKQGEESSIRSTIASLQQMKKICGKSGRSELKNEIRELKQLL